MANISIVYIHTHETERVCYKQIICYYYYDVHIIWNTIQNRPSNFRRPHVDYQKIKRNPTIDQPFRHALPKPGL